MVFPTRVFCESGGSGVEGYAVRGGGRALERSLGHDYRMRWVPGHQLFAAEITASVFYTM